ncbi:MAG: hypothetical protein JW866_01115 [Ignavibacteriales bacterium]|nr:hypothetical protein [Ignavibacteriales bacterium]
MLKKKLPVLSLIISIIAALFSVYTLMEKLSLAQWLGITASFFGLGLSLGSIIFKKQYFSNKNK